MLLVACPEGAGDDSSIGPGGESEQWYALSSIVFTPDGGIGHIVRTATLDEQDLTLADAIEVPGGGTIHSSGNGTLFSGTGESPVLTRYEIAADGTIREDGELSFANLGVTNAFFNGNQVQFVAEDEAYLILPDQIVRWDPTALEIVESVEIPGLDREGFGASPGYTTHRRGTELIWTMQWSSIEGQAVLDETALVVYDHATGALTVSPKQGCSAPAWGAVGTDGTYYWTSGAYEAALFELHDGAQSSAPCMVRLDPGATELADEVILLDTIAPGRLSGSLWGVSPGRATLRIFEPEEYEITADTTPADLTFRAPWSWHWLDLETRELTRIETLGTNGGSVFLYDMGGRTMIPAIPVTEDSTTLFDATAGEGEPIRSIFVPGNVYAAVRAR